MWRVSDLTTRALRTLLLPHARDDEAIVLRPFWRRWNSDIQGALAGKIGSHGPHHRFGDLGRLPHLQVNVWRIGVKGSGRYLRLPLLEPGSARRLVHTVGRGERRIA